ncbi:YfhE family protein [Alkalihalobacillus trypoxylicola]|nr:YfhE family protein [Alkalihalobacillus trypoxylicola]
MSKKKSNYDEKWNLRKALSVQYQSEFRAADRAAQSKNKNQND